MPPTAARRAADVIVRGSLRDTFWIGAIGVGWLLPAVLLAADRSSPLVVGIAGAGVLVGPAGVRVVFRRWRARTWPTAESEVQVERRAPGTRHRAAFLPARRQLVGLGRARPSSLAQRGPNATTGSSRRSASTAKRRAGCSPTSTKRPARSPRSREIPCTPQVADACAPRAWR